MKPLAPVWQERATTSAGRSPRALDGTPLSHSEKDVSPKLKMALKAHGHGEVSDSIRRVGNPCASTLVESPSCPRNRSR